MTDNPVFCGLAVIFTFLFLLNIRSFFKIIPSLLDSVTRWKGNLDLEDSLQLSGSRNIVALILFVPFCMVVYSHSLYRPDYMDGLTPEFQLAATTGTMLAYLALRTFLNWQLEMSSYHSKTFTAANRSFYNYAIILFAILFPIGGLINIFIEDKELTRVILFHIIVVTYIIYIFRRGQIFASACNPFTTFLYLCGLELLPTAALVVSAKLL